MCAKGIPALEHVIRERGHTGRRPGLDVRTRKHVI
jgi:hypothetical protein